MWETKLGVAIVRQFGLTPEELMEIIARVGFEAYFLSWEHVPDLKKVKGRGDELGLTLQSVHAPFVKMAEMWENSPAADAAAEELLRCLRDCADSQVPIMVCHTIIGFDKHAPGPEGIENFGKVVREAEKLGVKIAFENTEGEEYLDALLKAFAGERHVGFCWDTGHELCYNRGKDMLAPYGDRLFCTHLNDNLGIRDYGGAITFRDDLHLLPFDGIADWTGIAARLIRCGYQDILMFELSVRSHEGRHDNDKYSCMSAEEYFTETYARACRVAALKKAQSTK